MIAVKIILFSFCWPLRREHVADERRLSGAGVSWLESAKHRPRVVGAR